MHKRSFIIYKITFSVLLGLAIFVISCLAAWQSARNLMASEYREVEHPTNRARNRVTNAQLTTQFRIQAIKKAIEVYRKEKHILPKQLSDIPAWRIDSTVIKNEKDILPDGWGRPFQYSVNKGQYRIISYGRDGRPGGGLVLIGIFQAIVLLPKKHYRLSRSS